MKQIHNRLLERFVTYSEWHNNEYCSHYHWAVFLIASGLLLYGAATLKQIEIEPVYAQSTTTTTSLGNTTPGSLSGASPNLLAASRFVMPNENGSLVSSSVYFSSAAAAPNNLFQVVVYADNAGAPGARVAQSVSYAITPGAWNTAPLSGSLTANAAYWLAVNTNGSSNINYSVGVANATRYRAQTFGSIPNPF